MSSESLLRIVVFKPYYPKFLVNYPFVPLTAFLDLSESVVWNESGTNHESRTNQEHPHQWKMTPHQWKLRVTPTSGNIELDPTSGN